MDGIPLVVRFIIIIRQKVQANGFSRVLSSRLSVITDSVPKENSYTRKTPAEKLPGVFYIESNFSEIMSDDANAEFAESCQWL